MSAKRKPRSNHRVMVEQSVPTTAAPSVRSQEGEFTFGPRDAASANDEAAYWRHEESQQTTGLNATMLLAALCLIVVASAVGSLFAGFAAHNVDAIASFVSATSMPALVGMSVGATIVLGFIAVALFRFITGSGQ